MAFVAPVTQIINVATSYMLDTLNDSTKWYRGHREWSRMVSPPRYVYWPTRDKFLANVRRTTSSQTYANPENPWQASETVELHCWGKDLDDAWLRKSRAVKAIDYAMSNARGNWRILNSQYLYTDESKNVDRGIDYVLVLEFDIQQDQDVATEVEITAIHFVEQQQFGDGTIEVVTSASPLTV